MNGSNGAFRIDTIGRNTFRFPSTYVQDLRLSKTIEVRERYSVEMLADVFNLANHSQRDRCYDVGLQRGYPAQHRLQCHWRAAARLPAPMRRLA